MESPLRSTNWNSSYSGYRRWALLIGLTFFFFIDDFLMVFLAEHFAFLRIYKWVYYTAYAWLLLGSIALAYAVVRVMQKRPTTGAEGLQDLTGKVIASVNGQLQVQVRGEIWKAESKNRLNRGDRIIVEAVEGLTLMVRSFEKSPGE